MTTSVSSHPAEVVDAPTLDLAEHGRGANGAPSRLDRRLFMRLTAFSGCDDPRPLADALCAASIAGVLYEDLNDPRGVALLAFHEDPAYFLEEVGRVLKAPPFRALAPKPDLAMLGRTYAIGYEADLEETLLHRPRARVCTPAWPWAVWYPLRRTGTFAQLPATDQRTVLTEHGGVGRGYSDGGYAHDVRLACHGLDTRDNDFVIGLVGPSLHPISLLVQQMRRTAQTSMYLERLGPFFVGRAAWQSSSE